MSNQQVIDYVKLGVQKGIIKLYDDNKRIEYVKQNKSRSFANPEEIVQAETFCRLILEYGYPVQRVQNYVMTTRGSNKLEIDMIVYNDDECLQPHIVVECKKEDVSEANGTYLSFLG